MLSENVNLCAFAMCLLACVLSLYIIIYLFYVMLC